MRALLLTVISTLLVLGAVSAAAQECSESDQTLQDSCISDAIQTCIDVQPSCQDRVQTEQNVDQSVTEQCCCKNGNQVSKAKFNKCRNKFRQLFQKARNVFTSDFRQAIRASLKELDYDQDCNSGCDF
ncbi:MAG: hypothetical protein KDD70_02265 [Bdellovibrionales bacterium]|nr:hypothetical protein [Bdellovibrionales bacterium]